MRIRKALGINAASQLIIFVVNFTSIIVISRLLTPEEIGIFSVSVSILAFAHIFREFGVAQFLIQASEVTDERLRAAFTVTLSISWLIAAILVLGSAPIAGFYGSAGIADVLRLIAVNFIILPFGAPLLSLLRRDMAFDKIAIVNISNAVVGTAATISAALLGESYLSMAWGAVAGNVSNVLLLNFMRPGQIFMMPSLRGVSEVLRFGSLSSASSILTELGASAPDLILGRTLGFAPVAYYSRANGLRTMALGQIITLVRGVYLPSFAKDVRAGHDPAQLYCRATNYMVAVSAPALAILAVLSKPLILFLFGSQWVEAAPLATLICAFAIMTTPTSLASTSLVASGRVGLLLRTQIIIQSTKVLILLSSIWLPLDRVVLALGLAYLIESYVLLRSLRTAFQLGIRTLLRELRVAFALVPLSIAGPVSVLLAQHLFTWAPPHLLTLALSGVLALSGWMIGVMITGHPLRKEISSLFHKIARHRT